MDNVKNNRGGVHHSGIDLLRIVAMGMICAVHVVGDGGVASSFRDQPGAFQLAWLLEIFCLAGANIYALISGYVGYGNKSNRPLRKWLPMWFQVLFYSVGMTAVLYFALPGAVDLDARRAAVVPFFSGRYWYFGAYTAVLFARYYLNQMVEQWDTVQMKKAACLLLVFLCIQRVVTCLIYGDALTLNYGYSAIWLIILYILGAALKKSGCLERLPVWTLLLGFVLPMVASWAWKMYVTPAHKFIGRINFADYLSPTMVLAAVAILGLFARIREMPGWMTGVIRWLSPAMFGVYLFQAQPVFYKHILRGHFAWIADFAPWQLPLLVLAAALGIMVCGVALEKLRMGLFRLLRIEKLCDWLCKRVDRLFEKSPAVK